MHPRRSSHSFHFEPSEGQLSLAGRGLEARIEEIMREGLKKGIKDTA